MGYGSDGGGTLLQVAAHTGGGNRAAVRLRSLGRGATLRPHLQGEQSERGDVFSPNAIPSSSPSPCRIPTHVSL